MQVKVIWLVHLGGNEMRKLYKRVSILSYLAILKSGWHYPGDFPERQTLSYHPQTYKIWICPFNEIATWFTGMLIFENQNDTHIPSTAAENSVCPTHGTQQPSLKSRTALPGLSWESRWNRFSDSSPNLQNLLKWGLEKCFYKPSTWCLCILKFEKHCSRKVDFKLCILESPEYLKKIAQGHPRPIKSQFLGARLWH